MSEQTAPALEHLFSYMANLKAPPEIIGPVPEGIRVNFYVTDGVLTGPRLRGRLLPVGGDWLTLRRDGIGVLDVRATIETDDGALIDVAYRGIGDLGEDGYEKFLRGETPKKIALRTAPMLRTAHPRYQWLHRVFTVGVGEADFERFAVRYDVYSIPCGGNHGD
jgi:hypothetical protein